MKFPPEQVVERLKLVPKKLIRQGHTPEYDITLEKGEKISARVAGGSIGYIDLNMGEHRRARLDDWKEFVKLADVLLTIGRITKLHCGGVLEKGAVSKVCMYY